MDRVHRAEGPKPIIDGRRSHAEQIARLRVRHRSVPRRCSPPSRFAWGWGLSWVDVALFVAFYYLAGLGVTVGYHRYFTHGSFKAKRGAADRAGDRRQHGRCRARSITWVADHRRHHAFSDREGDPHSPWLFGTVARGAGQGLLARAHGLAVRPRHDQHGAVRPGPAGRQGHRAGRQAVRAVDRAHAARCPAVLGGLITWSWWGALTAFFWAGPRAGRVPAPRDLVGQLDLPHDRRAPVRRAGTRSANFWPLAILSFGESWHNLHHADPTCARHGVQARPDRHLRAADLDVREVRLGDERPLAERAAAGQDQRQRSEAPVG